MTPVAELGPAPVPARTHHQHQRDTPVVTVAAFAIVVLTLLATKLRYQRRGLCFWHLPARVVWQDASCFHESHSFFPPIHHHPGCSSSPTCAHSATESRQIYASSCAVSPRICNWQRRASIPILAQRRATTASPWLTRTRSGPRSWPRQRRG
ncbi:hypothetical protein VTK73DRAFT_1657 [Phialemonium thermophilum]|uniref:Uncharacterized protein n=1 Tax=Phialemonium thermophilum TaxID=223376 RepID=A0ABR3VT82_9PEZI